MKAPLSLSLISQVSVTWWFRGPSAAPESNKCRRRGRKAGEPRPLHPTCVTQLWFSCWLVAVTCGRAALPLLCPSVGALRLPLASPCQAAAAGCLEAHYRTQSHERCYVPRHTRTPPSSDAGKIFLKLFI